MENLMGNTGDSFEKYVYEKVKSKCNNDSSYTLYLHKKYYSLDRQDFIIPDITVEKSVDGHIFFIIVIECKEYDGPISVSEVEEFHSKLQQIGADNTKGILVTSNGKFQKSAFKYAESKGISLAVCNELKFGFCCNMGACGAVIGSMIIPVLSILNNMRCSAYVNGIEFDVIIDKYLK